MNLNATTKALYGYTKSYNQGSGPSKGTRDWIKFVGIGAAAFVLLVVLLVVTICLKKRKARRNAVNAPAPPGGVYYAPSPGQGGIPLGNQGPPQYQPVYGQGPGGQQGPYQPYGAQEYGQAPQAQVPYGGQEYGHVQQQQVPYGQQTFYPNK